jgi:phenylpropionate dioxygenase-like ring-hydroxylating dioxygenase large terminal subunit
MTPETVAFSPSVYTDPHVAAAERALVFGKVPQIVAHATELANPRDFLTVQLPNNKVIVVRQEDGTVRTFVNVCRHRGAMVENRPSGSCRAMSCPYHGWSYNLDGSLRAVPYDDSFGEFDQAQYGLVELPTEERHGFVWVIDSPDETIDVADWLGPDVDAALARFDLSELVCFRAGGFDEPVNWKILQDAFLDGYHIKFVHGNSAGQHIYTNTLAFQDFGRHCCFFSPRRTIDPWLDAPTEGVELENHVIASYFLAPNATLLKQKDHMQLLTFRPHPSDPAKARMEFRLLVPRQEVSGLDEVRWEQNWRKNWSILEAVIVNEDIPMLREAQGAIESRGAGPLVIGRNEVGNQVFHRVLRSLLSADA